MNEIDLAIMAVGAVAWFVGRRHKAYGPAAMEVVAMALVSVLSRLH